MQTTLVIKRQVLTAMAIVGLILVACNTTGNRNSATEPDASGSEKKAIVAEEEKIAEEELAEANSYEARSWLKVDSHGIFEGSKEEVSRLVEDFYAAGAKGVYITGAEPFNDVQLSASIVVVLPEDRGARSKVFKIEADYRKQIEDEPTPDLGQKYLRLSFD